MAATLSVSSATARYVSTTEGITAGSIAITKATTYATESAKVYNMGGKDWAQGETSVATRTILLLATVPSFSATKYTHLEDYNITKIGVCLKTDGTPDYTSPVIYDNQFRMWLTNVKIVSNVAVPSTLLTGTAPTSSDPYAYLRLPAAAGGPDLCYIKYRVSNSVDVTIKAPSGITLAYTFGLDGTQQAAGSVSPGSSKGVKLYRESGGNMTLVLTASPFNLDTFGGWTKDGTVVDPYSNPATFIANEAATYSCIIGQASTPTTSSGRLLYGKYGNLLYANTLKAASTHTIALSADFEVSGHIITCSITKPGEAQETATTEIPTAFSREKKISFPATGSASGKLLFADQSAHLSSGSLASQKRLVKILFHCDNAVHKYTLTIKIDGAEYFSDTLSGTFSRTIEVS